MTTPLRARTKRAVPDNARRASEQSAASLRCVLAPRDWGGWADPRVGVDHNKNKIGRFLLAFARMERHTDRKIGFIWHESQSSCHTYTLNRIDGRKFEIVTSSVFPSIFPSCLLCRPLWLTWLWGGDWALRRRPPRAPMTGLLYNLAPSRHLLLLRSGVSGRTKDRNRCRGRDM